MGIKRFKPEEIISKLRQVEVLCSQGKSIADAIRHISVSEQTYYRWKKNYGGMGTISLRSSKPCKRRTSAYVKQSQS